MGSYQGAASAVPNRPSSSTCHPEGPRFSPRAEGSRAHLCQPILARFSPPEQLGPVPPVPAFLPRPRSRRPRPWEPSTRSIPPFCVYSCPPNPCLLGQTVSCHGQTSGSNPQSSGWVCTWCESARDRTAILEGREDWSEQSSRNGRF